MRNLMSFADLLAMANVQEQAGLYAKPFCIPVSQPLAAPEFVSRGAKSAPKPPHELALHGRPLKSQANRLGNRPAKG